MSNVNYDLKCKHIILTIVLEEEIFNCHWVGKWENPPSFYLVSYFVLKILPLSGRLFNSIFYWCGQKCRKLQKTIFILFVKNKSIILTTHIMKKTLRILNIVPIRFVRHFFLKSAFVLIDLSKGNFALRFFCQYKITL